MSSGAHDPATRLLLSNASKRFGAVRALTDVSLELKAGEVHGLVGENGAGKSTLVKIIGGVHQPDGGSLTIDGVELLLAGPAAAREAGIAIIFQEPTLFPDLSIAENVFIARQPLRRGRRIDAAAMNREVNGIFARLGLDLAPERIARGLSIAEQQLVEIAKALSLRAKVVVMDEPTAALSAAEVERLFGVIDALKDEGAAILFISHRFDEVFAICQQVTVLRDGRRVLSRALADIGPDELVRAMVGRDVVIGAHERHQLGGAALEVRGLTREGVFEDASFVVRAGEVVGLAGLVGAGRSEVARAVFGIDRYDRGSVRVNGRKLRGGSSEAAMRAGMALVPEDRRQQGLVMDMSLQRNVAMASLSRIARFGLLRPRGERELAEDWSRRLEIRYGRVSDPVTLLSGGNQQKAVLAKWLARGPSILIIDEPTRGIDIGTKAEVHRMLSGLAGEGIAILMISSELPELLALADRILVLREGRIVAELAHENASEEGVMSAIAGQATEALSS